MIRSLGRVQFLRIEEIDWIDGAGNYARLHAGDETHLLRDTLKRLEARLDPEQFIRVHRSTIVNVERVRELRTSAHGEYEAVRASGATVASSRTYANRLQRLAGGSL